MRDQGLGIGDWRSGKLWLALAVVAVGVVIVVYLLMRQDAASTVDATSRRVKEGWGDSVVTRQDAASTVNAASRRVEKGRDDSVLTRQDAASTEDVLQTEQEKLVAATELLVEEFDSLVDAWRGQSDGTGKQKSVTLMDVENFAASFRKIPKARQNECIHRALNLVPDENVMLLAGVLMDKSMDREIVETVYNDILNRDENVKKPILQEIYKDKSHPCWADTAWILDVTGELPKAK